MTKKLATLTALLLSLAACGPDKSSLDLDREKRDEALAQKISENSKLVGTWEGTVSIPNKLSSPLKLIIWKKEVPGPNTGGAESPIVSVLTAYMTGEVPAQIFNPDATGSTTLEIILPEVAYDGRQRLVMKGVVTAGGAKEDALINASVSGDNITGIYIPFRPLHIGKTEVALSADISLTRK